MRSDIAPGFTGVEEATGLLDGTRSMLCRLIQGEYWKLDGDALLSIGRNLEHLSRLLWAAQVHLTDEIHQQHLATTLGATSTAALLRDAFRLTPAEASLRVRAAGALLPQDLPTGGEIPARRPVLAAAVDAGEITGAAVDAALRTFGRLPDTVPADTLTAAEHTLVREAGQQDPVVYRRIVEHLETVLHPDGPAPDDPAVHDKMELSIGPRNAPPGSPRSAAGSTIWPSPRSAPSPTRSPRPGPPATACPTPAPLSPAPPTPSPKP